MKFNAVNNKEGGKTMREWGESPPPPPFSLSSLSPFFFPRQANQGLALPKLKPPGQTKHPPALNDAVVK